MIIRCPSCGFTGRVSEDKSLQDSKRVVCPSCGHRFVVALTVLDDRPASEAVTEPAPPKARKRRRAFLWGCLAAFAVLAIGAAILLLVPRINKQIQESKEYDILRKLARKHPGYLILNTIAADPGSMTELQIESYAKGLVGKGCVGIGKVVEIQKTVGSQVLDFLGLNYPGTIIALTYERYDVDLVLEQSYADCWYDADERRVLLDTLFPRQASSVMQVN